MADTTRSGGLRTIFSFFLGLMLTAFVGVGLHTFYPPPEQFDVKIQQLSRREISITTERGPREQTAADRSQIADINKQRSDLMDAAAAARKPWTRNTSIILIIFATLSMAISLVRGDELPVISNGLLLGGVFTMLYGVGLIVFSDTSITRFVVMSVALLITLGLGYLRFVRRATPSPVAAGSGVPEGTALADIERRIRDLEGRVNDAALALGTRAR